MSDGNGVHLSAKQGARLTHKLFEDGTLLNLDISYWRGANALEAKDLGLSDESVADGFHLGRKELIPKRALKIFERIEREARKRLDERSQAFPMFRGRYVPLNGAFPQVTADLVECKNRFEKERDGFLENYGDIIEQMKPVIRRTAELALQNAGAETDRGAFIEDYVSRVLASYPSADDVRKTFTFEWEILSAERPNLSALKDTDAAALAMAKEKAQEVYEEKFNSKIVSFIEDTAAKVRMKVADLCAKAKRYVESDRAIPMKNLSGFRGQILALRDASGFLTDGEVNSSLSTLEQLVDGLIGEVQVERAAGISDLLTAIEGSMRDLQRVSQVTGEYTRTVQLD